MARILPPRPAISPSATANSDPGGESDDLALFRAAVADAQPLKPDNRARIEAPRPRPQRLGSATSAYEDPTREAPWHDRLGEGVHEAPASFLRTSVAKGALRDLRRGRWPAEDALDLHGLNREEARTALFRFVAQSVADGLRCVRVVHGKGYNSGRQSALNSEDWVSPHAGQGGILRPLVRGWLQQSSDILAYCPARPQEGGEGALLALLRAPKNSGKND